MFIDTIYNDQNTYQFAIAAHDGVYYYSPDNNSVLIYSYDYDVLICEGDIAYKLLQKKIRDSNYDTMSSYFSIIAEAII